VDFGMEKLHVPHGCSRNALQTLTPPSRWQRTKSKVLCPTLSHLEAQN